MFDLICIELVIESTTTSNFLRTITYVIFVFRSSSTLIGHVSCKAFVLLILQLSIEKETELEFTVIAPSSESDISEEMFLLL